LTNFGLLKPEVMALVRAAEAISANAAGWDVVEDWRADEPAGRAH